MRARRDAHAHPCAFRAPLVIIPEEGVVLLRQYCLTLTIENVLKKRCNYGGFHPLVVVPRWTRATLSGSSPGFEQRLVVFVGMSNFPLRGGAMGQRLGGGRMRIMALRVIPRMYHTLMTRYRSVARVYHKRVL